MSEVLTADQLEQQLYSLAVKINELQALEAAIDVWSPMASIAASAGTGLSFEAYYDAALTSQGGVISSGEYPELRGIPDFCRNILSIDDGQFSAATELLDGVALDMVDLQGAPGNVLNKIGNWYGDAAESFEEYFSGFSPSQARQAELLSAAVNSCASMEAMATSAKESATSLIKGAADLADEMIKIYWDTQKALQTTVTLGILSLAAAGMSAGASTGALALAGSVGGGASTLAGSVYSFQVTEAQLEADDLQSLLDGLNDRFREVEVAIRSADDEIYSSIDALRSEWSMREVAVPAPPAADEANTQSFHHESTL